MFLATESSEDRSEVSSHTNQRVLLIVDDSPSVLRTVARFLSGAFDKVLIARDSDQAERILKTNRVTHLISDYDLGAFSPRGTELVPAWRKKNPSIRRALILTSADLSSIAAPPEVDKVVSKDTSMTGLIQELED